MQFLKQGRSKETTEMDGPSPPQTCILLRDYDRMKIMMISYCKTYIKNMSAEKIECEKFENHPT